MIVKWACLFTSEGDEGGSYVDRERRHCCGLEAPPVMVVVVVVAGILEREREQERGGGRGL